MPHERLKTLGGLESGRSARQLYRSHTGELKTGLGFQLSSKPGLSRAWRGSPRPGQAFQSIPVHRLANILATGHGSRRESAHYDWRDSNKRNLGRSKVAPNTH